VRTCVLLHSGEGLLEGVGSAGALGGVRRQAVGVHGLHRGVGVSVGLMGDAGESVDEGRDEAGHRGGDVGWWRTEACWERKKKGGGGQTTQFKVTLSTRDTTHLL